MSHYRLLRPVIFALLVLLTIGTLATAQEFQPPKAKIIHTADTAFGDIRVDNYAWLRDRNNPDVIKYLEDENNYTALTMKPTEELQKTLYNEMLGRIKETDLDVPVKHGDYYYYNRTEQGKAYPIHCRKKGGLDAAEEIIFDENAFGAGRQYFSVGALEISPDQTLLAYSTDTAGSERFDLHIKNLSTGQIYPDIIPMTAYSVAWANDNKTLFYTVQDDISRPYKLFRHVMGTDAKSDVLVYFEPDSAYSIDINRT